VYFGSVETGMNKEFTPEP